MNSRAGGSRDRRSVPFSRFRKGRIQLIEIVKDGLGHGFSSQIEGQVAPPQPDDPGAESADQLRRVQAYNEGPSVILCQAGQQAQHLIGHRRVQGRHRPVGQNHLGELHHKAGGGTRFQDMHLPTATSSRRSFRSWLLLFRQKHHPDVAVVKEVAPRYG